MPMFRRGSYANVTATAALVIALGGTSYAAAQITSAQIKNGTIQAEDLKAQSVSGPKIKNGVVGSAKLSGEAQSRLAFTQGLDSLASGAVGATLATVSFTTGGLPGTNQLVLVSVHTQLDHDSALASGCGANFQLQKASDGSTAGSWFQELYSGTSGEEDNVSFAFVVTQPARSTESYKILGSNNCGQTLFTDSDLVTIEAFARAGDGSRPSRSVPAAPRPRNEG